MEQIVRILKQLAGTGSMLGSVPKPIKVGLLYLTVVVGVMSIFKYANLDKGTKTFLVIAILLMVVITGGYYAWKAWQQKKQNQQFGGDISQHSSATPRGLSDPGQRARLDDMRKKFQSGVEAYKSRGKDLYKLPWYVIVGEPGSGKTEAIRHSNVGFPPGMQDEFQGVGGTINMNWWFTNHAVLLDTAGRLMFEELKPGETSEWKEFLTLLKKNRPNCPVNGLFLVIPSDSLIKDSADDIQKKAGKIAQQLDVIQRVLDVRFPVFVVVTKCDKINGFREFFDGLTDPQLQHQMMGWSNPEPLDEPFKPERVEKHLEQVSARLSRRRLGLMRDPVPENLEGRRTDEVDTLYAFPHSLETLSSRLRRYLETIFVAGEWSAKPLFLRGIYFSSSMREGSALDAELAEAIGVSVEDLPEGKVWERERAYFLRDLFLEKVFREKGLVTRASNTKQMLRGQQVALFSFGFLALLAFAAVAWFAMGSLRSGVKDQGDYWHVVSSAGWENKYWKQSLVPMRGDGSFASTLSTNVLQVDNKTVNLGEFHAKLRDLAETRMKKNLMFPGLADRYNQNSRKAQRIVFEDAVIRPLIDASRQKMVREAADPAANQYEPDALAALIQLESDIISRGTPPNTGKITSDEAKKFLSSFQNYIAGTDTAVDTNLVGVMTYTYATNETAKGSWPPKWFSGGRGGTNTLAVNTGIAAGLDAFGRNATNGIQNFLTDRDKIDSVRKAARAFADSENELFAATGAAEVKFTAAVKAVLKARAALDQEITKASSEKLFADGMSLTNAQQKFRNQITASAGAALVRVKEVNDAALAAHSGDPLFKEIKEKLDRIQASLSSRVAELLKSGDMNDLKTLDETTLSDNAYAKRADLYARADKLMARKSFTALVGLKGEQLDKFMKDNAGPVKADAAAYTNKLAKEANGVLEAQLKYALQAQKEAFFTAYLAEAKKQLSSANGFPLVRDLSKIITESQCKEAGRQLKYISEDLASPTFKSSSPADLSDEWKKFIAQVQAEQDVAKALLGDDVIPGTCTILLAPMTDENRAKDEWRGKWRNMQMIADGNNSKQIRTETDTDVGEVTVQQKLEFKLTMNANVGQSETYSITTTEWGAVWLLLNKGHKAERDRSDAKKLTWLVEFPVRAPGPAGQVRMQLKFERPLPDLENWP